MGDESTEKPAASGSASEETPTSSENPDNTGSRNDSKSIKFLKLPSSYGKEEVEQLIKKHTTDDILASIMSIIIFVVKPDKPNERKAVVVFKSKDIAEKAHFLFRNVKDKTYIVQMCTYIPKTRGPDKAVKRENSTEAAKNHLSKIRKVSPEDDSNVFMSSALRLSRLNIMWKKFKILEYIQKYTGHKPEIVDGITFIYLIKDFITHEYKGVCSVKFNKPELAEQAKTLLTAAKYESGICVSWEDPKYGVIWQDNGRPDIVAMKQRDYNKQQARARKMGVKQEHVPPHSRKWQQNIRNEYHEQNYEYEENQRDPSSSGGKFHNDSFLANQEPNPNETYGMTVQFLESLDIYPPLVTKVFVGNLPKEYEDEAKIRKLFAHAGTVTDVAIIGKASETLKVKVDFDHPVEAVQAISMFHGQEIYGSKLVVQLDKTYNAYKRFTPPGLKAFGPGLGHNGLPLKNVRGTIELQRAINKLSNDIEMLKAANSTYQVGENQNTNEYKNPEYQNPDEYRNNEYQRNDQALDNASMYSNHTVHSNPMETSGAVNVQNPLAATLTNPQNNPLLALSALLNPQATQMLQLLQQAAANPTVPNAAQLVMPQAQPGMPQAQPGMPQAQPNVTWNPNPASADTNPQPSNYNASDMQGRPNMPGRSVRPVPNVPHGPNMGGGPNMQGGPNMGGGPNMQGGPNMGGGPNMQGGPNMGGGPNMQGGPYPQRPYDQDDSQVPYQQGYMQGLFPQGGPTGRPPANVQGEMEHKGRPKHDDCMVQFNYLPPSVTLAALHSKMSEVGKVRSAEITGPGRAIVSFYSPRDAASCIKLLDHTKVDGQCIDVRYL